MHAFSLPPVLPATASAETPIPYSGGVTSPPPGSSISLPRGATATLRKSFRKTLKMHQGFRVRMRTVFVPYFLLAQDKPNGIASMPREYLENEIKDAGSSSDSDVDEDILEEREQREAGNEEHTVVLSVEVENLFPGGPSPTDARTL